MSRLASAVFYLLFPLSVMAQPTGGPSNLKGDCDMFTLLLAGTDGYTTKLPRNCARWDAGFAASLMKMDGFRQGGWTPREQLCLVYRIEDLYLPVNQGGRGKEDLREAITFCKSSRNPW